jgi:assimilatory nitrate reductase catalytic subunit
MRDDTVFVPFHFAGESAVNRLTMPTVDPESGMPEFKVCAIRVEPPP